MPRGALAITVATVVGLVVGACAPVPAVTPSFPASPTSTATAAPSDSPQPAPSSAPGPAVGLMVPPRAGTPEGDGIAGLDWAMTNEAPGYGTVIAKGPAGWLSMLAFDGEIPSTPDLRLSPDLRTWTPVTPADPVITCGDNGSIAATGEAYVLACAGGAWVSRDGRAWKAVDATGAWGAVPGMVPHVASDGSTFLASLEAPAAPAVWVSSGGEAWTEVSLPDADAVIVEAVSARADGGFVVAGRAGESVAALEAEWGDAPRWATNPGVQAVWTAAAGATSWTRLALGDGWEAARITSIAADGPGGGLVAAGLHGRSEEETNEEPVPAVWRSVTGESWDRLDGPAFGLLEDSPGSTRVLSTPDRWLIIGSRLKPGGTSYWDVERAGVVGGSEDGGAWWMTSPVTLGDGAYSIDAAVVDGRRIVLVTPVQGPEEPDARTRIWVSPP